MISTIFNNLWIIFVFIFLLFFLYPGVRHTLLEAERFRIIRRLEQKRKSRVILLIHRQETISFFGIPITRFIDMEDSESILRAIRLTPDNIPIDVVVHTPGGIALAVEQIARALANHPSPVTIFIPQYAMSGGTLIALASDKIMMDENAVIGPLDPQVGEYPAYSILSVVERKPIKEIRDKTLILEDIAKKGIEQTRNSIAHILKMKGESEDKARKIAEILSSGKWTHDYPIYYQEALEIGLPIEVGLPPEVYYLIRLYSQPQGREPSVQYIPMPYGAYSKEE